MSGGHGVDIERLRAGDRRTLARAITLVESLREDHREAAQSLLEEVLPQAGGSLRVGISGVPGVGKSTFIEALGLALVAAGHRIAVLAVDPSSPRAGGSLLGDKTRMERLSRSQAAFIRPSPAAGTLGGVALRTRESLLLCEVAGFDVVLVETVGVGQSEVDVAGMVDFFLVLLLPNAGDELQGLKRGIVELADALVVNKADAAATHQAETARGQYESALSMLQHEGLWRPRVLTCSALEGRNIDGVQAMLADYRAVAGESGYIARRRAWQNEQWMTRLTHELVEQRLRRDPALSALVPELQRAVAAGELSPLAAARRLVSGLAR